MFWLTACEWRVTCRALREARVTVRRALPFRTVWWQL